VQENTSSNFRRARVLELENRIVRPRSKFFLACGAL
jgi:hypothetical protein